MSEAIEKKELAYASILACIDLLKKFETDNSAEPDDREITADINNPFIRSGLLHSIELAAYDLLDNVKAANVERGGA